MTNCLRQLRISKGISVKQLKKALSLKTDAAYYKKEKGKIKFSLEEAKIVADIFNMDIEEVFFNEKVSKIETECG